MFRRFRRQWAGQQFCLLHLSFALNLTKLHRLEPEATVACVDWHDSADSFTYTSMPISVLVWTILSLALFPFAALRCLRKHGETQFYTTKGQMMAATIKREHV
jgi:hypothetical protein